MGAVVRIAPGCCRFSLLQLAQRLLSHLSKPESAPSRIGNQLNGGCDHHSKKESNHAHDVY